MEELCDQNSSGVETAQVVVYTRRGPLMLCSHHYNRSAALFLARGYVSTLVRPDDPDPAPRSVMGQYGGQWSQLSS